MRNTLEIVKEMGKGKDVAADKISVDSPSVQTKKKNPDTLSHLEVSVQTQQLQVKHMQQDRREKEHLNSEINNVANIARVLQLFVQEDKRRT